MNTNELSYEIYPSLVALSGADRERVRSAVAGVSEELVAENPRYWSALMALDVGDKGAALAYDADKPVGFWVVERLHLGTVPGFYSVLTNVLPEYQEKRVAWQLRMRLLPREIEHDDHSRFFAFCTRNPRAWQLNASHCKAVVPDIFGEHSDADLLDLGKRAAKQLFPDNDLDFPSMVMAKVFPPMCCGAEQQHHRHSDIESAFFAPPALADHQCSRFFIGMLKTADELRAMRSAHIDVPARIRAGRMGAQRSSAPGDGARSSDGAAAQSECVCDGR